MQEHGQRRFANWIGLLLLASTVLATSGCASMYHLAHYNWLTTFEQSVTDHHRPYYHSGRTGRIIAKTHRHYVPVEPDCFGYEPTCWYNWPSHCVSCPPPEQVVEEEVVEPQPTQQLPEEALQQRQQGDGLEGILDLDQPAPGEQPILPNRGGGASVVPPAPLRQVAPEPRSSSRPGVSVTKQQSIDQLMHDRVVGKVEPDAPNVAAYKAAIARRHINQRMELVDESVGPQRVSRDDRPLAFVDGPAEVADITPDADVTLPTETRPAPPALAPSIVQSVSQSPSPSLVQAVPADDSSRRTIRFAPAPPSDQPVADMVESTVEPQAEPQETEGISKTDIEPKLELKIESVEDDQTVQVAQNDTPARLDEEPVQSVQHDELPVPLNQEPVERVREEVSLPSFKIVAVGPNSAETQIKTEATTPAATVRFVSGKQPKSVRVSARELRGEGNSDLKFR